MPTWGSRLDAFLRPSWNALTVNRTPVSPQRRAFCFQALISSVSPFRFASSTRTWCSRCRSSPRNEPAMPQEIFVVQDGCGTRNRRTLAMRQGSTMSIVLRTMRRSKRPIDSRLSSQRSPSVHQHSIAARAEIRDSSRMELKMTRCEFASVCNVNFEP